MKKFIRLILSAVVIFSNFSMHVKAEAKKPEVSAKACVLIEEKTGRIVYEKNSSQKLPMASTTKIMTTLLCLESGNLDDELLWIPMQSRLKAPQWG